MEHQQSLERITRAMKDGGEEGEGEGDEVELSPSISAPIMKGMQRIPLVEKEEDYDPEKAELSPTKVSFFRMLKIVRGEVGALVWGTICLAISSGAQMAVPAIAGRIVDSATSTDKNERLNVDILSMMVLFIIAAFFSFLRYYAFTMAGYRIVVRLRNDLFKAILRQEIGFFDANRTGELINRLSADVGVVQNALTVNVSMALRTVAQLVAGVGILFVISWRLTLVMLSVLPLIVVGALAYGKFIRKYSKAVQDALARSNSVSEEAISSVRTVRSFSQEEYEFGRYEVEVDQSFKLAKTSTLATGLFIAIVGFVASGAMALVLWYGGHLVIQSKMSAGDLTSFILYTLMVSMAVGTLSNLFGDFMKSIGASERVFQLMDRTPKVRFRGGDTPLQFKGLIRYENVFFAYPSRPDVIVLKGVDLECKPGQVVALVGPSGGGKSTMVALLEAFYYPVSGHLTIDGVDIRDLDPEFLHDKVGLVSQEPTLFAASISDNIAYGIKGKKVSIDSIIEAAKHANAHDFITSLPQGYDTLVGERGVRLSGGQKQRVAIARAVLKDPTILLLDEATSALDAESEYLVKKALDELMQHRTTLVIAHRLSTVKNAHKVVVVESGTIAQEGTHEQLMSQPDGVYAKLVQRQLQKD
eukprot:Phypoly_transcript_04970.p1 GENE.Phypoly_transcript_04970~~Phypoly_transcript_04970.p1  ORF type:complete len:643 (+),score=87.69 Phypoly_transcript_04970:79-2007(+)